MNKHTYLMTILIGAVCIGLTACSNHIAKTSGANTITADAAATDSLTLPKAELTKIYSQAIAEFIKGAYKRDQTTFDTLYFGKHVYGQADDFPDIDLLETIENTHIMLVTPEVGQKKQQESKSLVYINMMGWVSKEQAVFIFVVFSNGGEHQHDYFVDFTYNAALNTFELSEIGFENLPSNGQKRERIFIYKDGKYVVKD